jgi:hypothetical protein
MDRQQKRQRRHRRNQFAHQPGGFIAVKQLIRDLQMERASISLPSASCRLALI